MRETRIAPPPSATGERPELLILCGIAGLAGNVAPFAAMALSVPVARHDFIADTISDLGRGPHAWIMDTGFYMNAAGMLALAIGAAHLHLGRWFWSLGILCLALLALVTVLLGIWDEFGAGPGASPDVSVHTKITYALAPLYVVGPLSMAGGAVRLMPRARVLFVASAVLWAAFAVAFKLAPGDIDGIVEKVAIAATYGWTLPLALLLLRRGSRDARQGRGSAP
ncbi:DUF998 domain-containing protein [Roseibacterium sp. SDUM158017]|uniref:DUF998 domain-containing protein n=1 Tax=Roseicyclus salinarum TaxID=3036773 RepID=UPI00241511BC|nr:DUF998 domain-containing protein [Roseibacterium sp. SDUM158017]MDG4650501.1 DUF998 domain-containing protein [Roseibacterium sp. SDUM158017]